MYRKRVCVVVCDLQGYGMGAQSTPARQEGRGGRKQGVGTAPKSIREETREATQERKETSEREKSSAIVAFSCFVVLVFFPLLGLRVVFFTSSSRSSVVLFHGCCFLVCLMIEKRYAPLSRRSLPMVIVLSRSLGFLARSASYSFYYALSWVNADGWSSLLCSFSLRLSKPLLGSPCVSTHPIPRFARVIAPSPFSLGARAKAGMPRHAALFRLPAPMPHALLRLDAMHSKTFTMSVLHRHRRPSRRPKMALLPPFPITYTRLAWLD